MVAGAATLALTAISFVAYAARKAEDTGVGAAERVNTGPTLLGQLRYKLGDVRLAVAPANRRLAQKTLVAMPLSSDPFVALALAGTKQDAPVYSPEKTAFLREALKRNPRSRNARILLIQQYALADNIPAAFRQLAILDRLSSSSVEQLMGLMANSVEATAQIDEVLSATAKHPRLQRAFLKGFVAADKSPELIRHLTGKLPASALRDTATRRTVIDLLVAADDAVGARALWVQKYGAPKDAIVFSPDFSNRTSPPPFNWRLEQSSAGAAERKPGGGMSVVYYDRQSGVLLSQLLTAPVGNYVATLRYDSVAGPPGAIALRIRCANDSSVLAEERLLGKNRNGQTLQLEFAVPTNCTGQYLELLGLPRANERGSFEILARRLSVQKLGR